MAKGKLLGSQAVNVLLLFWRILGILFVLQK